MKNTDPAGALLRFQEVGQGHPLIILHGLFGSGRNWGSVARSLSDKFRVFSLDQRNHGDSPQFPSHTLDDLANDLGEWIESHLKDVPVLLGHSMGGIAAMEYTLRHPDQVRALIVVDVAPRPYEPRHSGEFQAMEADLSSCQTRSDVDRVMAPFVPDVTVRQFLQTNLIRTDKGFAWRIPVETLKKASFLQGFEPGRSWNGPTLFITGSQSDYTSRSDHTVMRQCFPEAYIETIEGAGHWPHFSHLVPFLGLIKDFLGRAL